VPPAAVPPFAVFVPPSDTVPPAGAPPESVPPVLGDPPAPQPMIGAYWQPSCGSHESVVQASESLQTVGSCPHTPAEQVSVVQGSVSAQSLGLLMQPSVVSQLSSVHGLLSLQFAGACEQAPFAGLQLSTVQASLSLQFLA